MNITGIATAAIYRQTERMAASASRVASAGDPNKTPQVDLAREAVERIESSNLTSANLAVIKSEDERLGHLLDTFV